MDRGGAGSRLPAALFGLALALPGAWRRRRPLAALAGTVGVYVVWVATDPPRGSIAPYLVLVVATYSVAVHGSSRQSWAGPGLAAGAEVLFFSRAVRAEVDREEKARTAVAEERGRIARELHDIISHSVSVMVVQAGAAEQVMDSDAEQVRTSLRAIQQTGRDARLELRRLLGLLRSDDDGGPGYGPQPGLAQLGDLVEQLRVCGLDLDVRTEGPARALPDRLDLAAFRIVQEAVTNAVKHSGGRRATVLVRYCHDVLDIEVTDGGTGGGSSGGGFGLAGMRERVALYGGELTHGRQPDGGFRVHARLPLPAEFRP